LNPRVSPLTTAERLAGPASNPRAFWARRQSHEVTGDRDVRRTRRGSDKF
jgi:hypothetical protein